MKTLFGHVTGGMLLVCGTSVGAGMLALPVVTAAGGFWPALLIFFICYFFMMCTGLLLMEIALKMPEDSNIISMAKHYFGTKGKIFAWVLYLFLFYLLSVAYVSGAGEIFHQAFDIPNHLASIIFCFTLASVVICGAKIVDRLNYVFMIGLVLTYVLFAFIGVPYIDFSNLSYSNTPKAFLALPVIFTSFSYQGLIPSLTYYMNKDEKKLRLSIILGTTLTFIIYFIFQLLIFGIVPIENILSAKTAVEPLKTTINVSIIYPIAQVFALLAIVTSFLGVTLGLFDFLADGLNIEKKGSKKLLIASITFIPPLLVALTNPDLFLVALGYAGGIGCALLLGLLPVLMVYSARYVKKETYSPQLFGGRAMLWFLMAFVVFELAIEALVEYIRISY